MKPKQQKTPNRRHPTRDTQQETIDCVITKEEVVSAIKKLKSSLRKAPGPDGIPVETLKCFTDRMCDTLSVIFNKDVQIKHLSPRIAWGCGTITRSV